MNPKKLLQNLAQGCLPKVALADFVHLMGAFGFRLLRTSGSHHIFGHTAIPELVHRQNMGGQAKFYQSRQFLRLMARYNIKVVEK